MQMTELGAIVSVLLVSVGAFALVWRERQRSAELLRQVAINENRLQKVFMVSPIPLTLSELDSGRYVMVNQAWQAVFGYSTSDAVGKTSIELGIWPTQSVRDEILVSLCQTGSIRNRRALQLTKAGKPIEVALNIEAIEFSGVRHLVVATSDLTERETAEMRFRGIFELSAVGMAMVDATGQWLLVNHRLSNILGYSETELSTRTFQSLTYPDDLPDNLANMESLLSGRRNFYEMEKRYVRKDGSVIWTKVTVALTRGLDQRPEYFVAAIEDISPRKAAERAIGESELRYRSIFAASPQPMWVWDHATLKFLDVNETALRQYGYSRQEFMQLSLTDVRPPDDVQMFVASIKDVSPERPRVNLRRRHQRRDGSIFQVEVSTHEITFEGRPAEVVLINDITERLAAEDAIRQMNVVLEQRVRERTAQLTDLNKELESFTYSVAHDLRSPLRAIDGFTYLLAAEHGTGLNVEAQSLLSRVRGSARQMAAIIDDLLAYARIEQSATTTDAVALTPLIAELVQTRQSDAPNHRITGPEEFPEIAVRADRNGLLMVLRNLLDNAIKFSANAPEPQVTVRCSCIQDVCRIQVTDNGIGFDMAFHDQIFNMFQRLNSHDSYSGTGIGLAIVRKAMQRMGGRVWAESQSGAGAQFFIELPLDTH